MGVIMRLTTKGRSAVAALIDLSLPQHRSRPVTLAAISQRQRISLSYLEQLFAKLRQHQLVESTRGPGGGYRLAKPLDAVSVADIVFAVDEPLQATPLAQDANSDQCKTQHLWASLDRQMADFLDSVSLRDLVEQQLNQVSRPKAAVDSPRAMPSNLS